MSLSEKLISAAKNGNTREVRKLLGRGALFTKDQFGNTALHEAAWNGNNDIVKILLSGYCFVDSINHTGFTPLHLASQNGHVKVAKTLLKWKADPTLVNQHGETALHLIAKYNHANVIAPFAAFKVNMDIRGKDCNTALHIAAKLGNSEVTKALLHAGANPILTNDKRMRPVDYAESGGYRNCVKLLHSATVKRLPRQRSATASSNMTLSSVPPSRTARAESVARAESIARSQTPTELEQDCVDRPRMRMQRTLSASAKLNLKTTKEKESRSVWSALHKKKHKKNSVPNEQLQQESSFPSSPGPHLFSTSQPEDGAFGGGGYMFQHSRSVSPHTKYSSIEHLLNEIEMEYNGAGYRSQENTNSITPYAEISKLELEAASSSSPSRATYRMRAPLPAKAYLKSTREGQISKENYDFLDPAGPLDHYDYLRPDSQKSLNSSDQLHSVPLPCQDVPSTPPKLPPARQVVKKSLPPKMTKHVAPPAVTQVKDTKKHGKSELDQDYADTYVYMAPLKDFPELLDLEQEEGETEDGEGDTSQTEAETSGDVSAASCQEPSVSPSTPSKSGCKANKKAAVICTSPIEAEVKHEPNPKRGPVKGILSQPSDSEAEKSQLEKYLNDELETMRQAFQIRLAQIEKRYRRQLIMEQKRNKSPLAPRRNPLSPPIENQRPFQRNSSKRRNSWHSCMAEDQELDQFVDPDNRSGSALGVDSDHSVDDSDIEPEWIEEQSKLAQQRSNTLADESQDIPAHPLAVGTRGPSSGSKPHETENGVAKPGGGLKGGNRMWKEESEERENPRMSPVKGLYDEDDENLNSDGLTEEAKLVIQKKIQDCHKKMVRYFCEKSEAQIAHIEKKYQEQMGEVERQCSVRASEAMGHLKSRIKDLESMLDVQTLV